MKKIIIALAAVLATATCASALDYTHSVVVNKTDGTSVEYSFEETPVATIVGQDMKMTYNSGKESVLYPIAEISNMTIVAAPAAVNSIRAERHTTFGISRGLLEARGLKAGSPLTLCDLAGATIAEAKADSNGNVTLNIANLPSGVYVVNADGNSFKFIR